MKLNRPIYFAFAALVASPVFAAELTVGCNDWDFTSIQDAVDAANPYDTITVCPGTYPESVLIQTEGLTIQSTEIPERGPWTIVNRFAIGFAPNVGPHSVTIKGFTVTGGSVGIESSGDYATIAYNHVNGSGIDPAIRVNRGNVRNIVHHNLVYNNAGTGIEIEGYNDCCGGTPGPGEYHDVHHNTVIEAGGEGCYYVWSDNTEVHQNQAVGPCGNGGINANGSTGLHIHHNEICSANIELFGAVNAYVHHNELTGIINNANGDDTLKKNDTGLAECPVELPPT